MDPSSPLAAAPASPPSVHSGEPSSVPSSVPAGVPSKPWPEQASSLLSQLSFSYLSPLFSAPKASRWAYDVHPADASDNLLLPDLPASAETAASGLTRLLFHANRPMILHSACFQLVFVVTSCSQPLLLRALINLVTAPADPSFYWWGSVLSLLLGLVSAVGALSNQRVLHLSQRVGHRVRTALIAHIYGRAAKGGGRNVAQTLVVVDCDKIRETLYEMNLVWSCPLQFVIITVLLLVLIGPSALLGILLLLSLLPAIRVIVGLLHAYRVKRTPMIDERVNRTSEFLRNVKTFKLNFWEEQYLKPVIETREGPEQALILRELWVWGCTLLIMVMSPVISTYGVFVFYVSVAGGILTPGDTFAVRSEASAEWRARERRKRA